MTVSKKFSNGKLGVSPHRPSRCPYNLSCRHPMWPLCWKMYCRCPRTKIVVPDAE